MTTPSTVLTVDATDIPAGLYLLYQMQAYSSAVDLQADSSKNVLKDTIEDVTGADWIHAETVRLAKRYVYIESAFEAEGLSLTEDELSAANTQASTNYTTSESTFAKNGIGLESYTAYYLNETKYDKLYTAYNEANADSISDTEAKAYMDKTYSRIATLMLPTTDADNAALSEENTAKIQALADDLQKQLAAGGSMDELAPDVLKKAFELCGREYTDDALTSYQYTTFVTAESSYFAEDVTADMLSAAIGDANQTTYGAMPMVYQKVANYTDNDDFVANYRDAIVSSICVEKLDAEIATACEAYTVTENASAVKTYSAKKVVTA